MTRVLAHFLGGKPTAGTSEPPLRTVYYCGRHVRAFSR